MKEAALQGREKLTQSQLRAAALRGDSRPMLTFPVPGPVLSLNKQKLVSYPLECTDSFDPALDTNRGCPCGPGLQLCV